MTGEALVAARKAGYEYRLISDRKARQLVTKSQQLYPDLSDRTPLPARSTTSWFAYST